MLKSTILSLFLVTMLFLAAPLGMSMQVSAIEETEEKLQSFSGSKKNGDTELICEECIKYWLSFLNPQETLVLINALANAINHINFKFIKIGQDQTCEGPGVKKVNPLRGVECLPVVPPNKIQNAAQIFDICKQLELALKYLDKGPKTSPLEALVQIGKLVYNYEGVNQAVVLGLFKCLDEFFMPVIFPSYHQPIRAHQESAVDQESVIDQESAIENLIQQQSIEPLQQQQIDQIEQEIKQSIGQENQHQQQQQQNQTAQLLSNEQNSELEQLPSGISQEQMHQQQILKLKQLQEAIR
jgi:hypothetical protein